MKFKAKIYPGYDQDPSHWMSQEAKLIREAWAFGLLPEEEKCEGWQLHQFDQLWEKVDAIWEKADFRVDNLPPDIQEKYMALQTEALKRAKAAGWDPKAVFDDDE
ncbi:MAG TPA: hypothetical protein EYH46_01980 [Sulfurivirga caldicuralii]|nr:hypothetical protein [Sulfurivirga caldicuralii]